MPPSPDPSPTPDIPSYHSHHPLDHLQHPDLAHWLTLASPIARATSFDRPYAPGKISAPSSDSGSPTMEAYRPHQPDPTDHCFNDVSSQGQPIDSLPHLHLSALEHTSTWETASPYQMSLSMYDEPNLLPLPPSFGSAYSNIVNPSSPYSAASIYDDSPLPSPYFSSPETAYTGIASHPPRSLPHDKYDYDEEDEEDAQGGRPYARLIYEALLQAPGHRMMLRDIYDWFEKNTTKPRESGTNGWQNSIRHNLSMNHAFENDKTQSTNVRGEPKKATSVWFLTENALRTGVQSTTRYRKSGGSRKTAFNRRPDAQRARSGAKGGRAARRAARLRQIEQSPHMSWTPPASLDDLEPFNRLVHAANTMNAFRPTRSNSPPSPPEQYPCTPGSPGRREEISMQRGHNTKYEPGLGEFESLNSQDLLFPQALDTGFDDAWFRACQQS